MDELEQWLFNSPQLADAKERTFRYSQYFPPPESEDWDHEHCLACWQKIMLNGPADAIQSGYVNASHQWLCPTCFNKLCDLGFVTQ